MAFELPTLDFMGHRKTAAVASVVLVIVTIVALAIGGINRGLDFTGGALVEVGFATPVEPVTVRSVLDDAGLTGGIVQNYGSETEALGADAAGDWRGSVRPRHRGGGCLGPSFP